MLIDTNLLVRNLQPHHPLFPIVDGAIAELRYREESIYCVAQNLIELWSVATRPLSANGLGLSIDTVQTEISRMEQLFILLPDNSDIYLAWKKLVVEHRVIGKPAHDARLVAAMYVHGIDSILTFDKTGFSRYPGIKVIDPREIVNPAATR